ncbi:MAG TPA: plastocyanin/azurin family copper-binding protein [Gaiellaceae bacterium]|jgi:uncharacterized cupredoxin-like copper-binding protein
MKIRNVRLLVLAAVSASFALLWALPAGASPARTSATTVTVTGGSPSEFGFVLSAKKVKHGTVTFKFVNKGNLPHDLKICSSNKGTIKPNTCVGKVTPQIAKGKTATLKITFAKAGKYEYLCTVPAHAQNGMKGVLTVT